MGYWQELRGQRRFFTAWIWVCAVLAAITALSAWINLTNSLDTIERLHKSQMAQREAEMQLESFQLGQDSLPPVFHMERLAELAPLSRQAAFAQSHEILAKAQSALSEILTLRQSHAPLLAQRLIAWENLRHLSDSLIQALPASALEVQAAQGTYLAGKSLLDWVEASPQEAALHEAEGPYMSYLLKSADSLLLAANSAHLDKTWQAFVAALRAELQQEALFTTAQRQALNLLSSLSIALHAGSLRAENRSRWAGNIYLFITLGLLLLILLGVQQLLHDRHLDAMTSPDANSATTAELHAVQERIGNLLLQVDKAWLESRKDLKQIGTAVQQSQDLESKVFELQSRVTLELEQAITQLQDITASLQGLASHMPLEVQERIDQLMVQIDLLVRQEKSTEAKLEQELEILGSEGLTLYHELQEIRRSLARIVGGTEKIVQEGAALEEQGNSLTRM